MSKITVIVEYNLRSHSIRPKATVYTAAAPLEMWYRDHVYNRCHESYIGSTVRHTHDRVKEHVTKPSSSVYKHLASHGSSESEITVKILIGDNDPVKLRLKEALYIQRKKPKINSKDECNELVDLLF